MTKKKKPRGYFAVCQCGVNVGAIDLIRTERKDAGKILGQWVHDGCVLQPMFSDHSVYIEPCKCEH